MEDRGFNELLDRTEEANYEIELAARLKRASAEDLLYLCEHAPSSVRYASAFDQLEQHVIDWVLKSKLYRYVKIEDLLGENPRIKRVPSPWQVFGNTWSKIAHLPSRVPKRNPDSYRLIDSHAKPDSLYFRPCKSCRPFQIIPVFLGRSESKILDAINCGCPKKEVKIFKSLRRALSEGYSPCPVIKAHVACSR